MLFRLHGGVTVPPWATFPGAPQRSRTVGFPESGSDLGMSFRGLPSGKEAHMLAHERPSYLWFAHGPRPVFKGKATPAQCPGPAPGPPSVQGSFARRGCDPQRRSVVHCVVGRYPNFIAPTSPCARPNASRRLRLPNPAGLRRLSPVPAGRWSFPTLALQSVYRCPDPYPAVPLRCLPVSSRRALASP